MKRKNILIFLGILIIIISGYFLYRYRKIIDPPQEWSIEYLHNNLTKLSDLKRYNIIKHQYSNPITIPVLYINMDKSTNRRKFMETQFSLLGLNSIRIEAIDGNKLDLYKGSVDGVRYTNNYQTRFSTSLNHGELGCTLSHIKAAKFVYEKGIDTALIVEDDCSFTLLPYWGETLSDIIQKAPAGWGALQLFSISNYCYTYTGKFLPHRSESPCFGTTAYVLSRKGASDILEQCGDGDISLGKNIDKYSNELFPRYGTADRYIYECTASYYYTIPLFTLADELFGSTIHPSHEKSHIDAAGYVISKYNRFNVEVNRNYNKQIIFSKVLYDMDKFMTEYGIPYHLAFGTALGMYREGGFIDHDSDIDLGVFNTEYNPDIEQGNSTFKLTRKFGTINRGYECTFLHIPSGISVDIFLVYSENDFMWMATYTGHCDLSNEGMCRWKIPKITTISTVFCGKEFMVPDPIDDYLIALYGPNWNIPLKYTYNEGIEQGLYRGLIQTDFPVEHRIIPKSPEIPRKYDWWPKKIRENKKPVVWMYWQNKNPDSQKPKYLNLCMETIRRNCGDKFDIIVLDDKMINVISRLIKPEFVNIDPIGMRADYIRFCLLLEYGGIWLDADTIVSGDIMFMIDTLNEYNFVAFYHDHPADISVGVMAANPNNRICAYYKYIFENDRKFNGWLTGKFKVSWGEPTNALIEYMKEIKSIYPKEYRTYPARKYIYPTHWTESKDYYWSPGKLDKYILEMPVICLHNETYTEYQKNISESNILKGNMRISELFRHILGK